MADISVENSQLCHNRDSLSPLQGNDEDSDPFSSPSPTERNGSPQNVPIFDVLPHTSSPNTSPQHSDDEISVLFSDYHSSCPVSQQHRPSLQHRPSSPFTPIKLRPSGFRNPSSVRALQDTTPPHYHLTSPLSTGSKQHTGSYFPTPSRKGTPRSRQRSPSKISPSKRSTARKEYPLILLHVTLLPIVAPYSKSVMERVLPPYILSNWKLLRERVTTTVLDRGILIPHPREDYDLLEERLLESLELRIPRILACGHFHLDEEKEAELLAASEELDAEVDDTDICPDCGCRVYDGRNDAGTGSRRWDIKLFAANGLMRAGAWGAAWREMERVDVEICPWIGEELKRELETARQTEEQDEALRCAVEEDNTQNVLFEEGTQVEDRPPHGGLDDARMREIYGDRAPAYMDGLNSSSSPSASPSQPSSPASNQRKPSELSLSTLLANYFAILARDPRNIAIAFLSLLVLVLAIISKPSDNATNILPSSGGSISQTAPITSYKTKSGPETFTLSEYIASSSSVTRTEVAPAAQTAAKEQDEGDPGYAEHLEAIFELD